MFTYEIEQPTGSQPTGLQLCSAHPCDHFSQPQDQLHMHHVPCAARSGGCAVFYLEHIRSGSLLPNIYAVGLMYQPYTQWVSLTNHIRSGSLLPNKHAGHRHSRVAAKAKP